MGPAEDLTTKARVRNAALQLFGTDGYSATSLRGIADEAGTSLGVVQHHFGNKEGLRSACDSYTLTFLRDHVAQTSDPDKLSDPDFLRAVYGRAPVVLRYLGKALAEGSPTLEPLFDELVTITENYLAEHSDVTDLRAVAAVLVTMRLGVYALHDHLSRSLGGDSLSLELLGRIASAHLEIVAPELVGLDMLQHVREGLNGLTAENETQTTEATNE